MCSGGSGLRASRLEQAADGNLGREERAEIMEALMTAAKRYDSSDR